jgi:hypothetical protein
VPPCSSSKNPKDLFAAIGHRRQCEAHRARSTGSTYPSSSILDFGPPLRNLFEFILYLFFGRSFDPVRHEISRTQVSLKDDLISDIFYFFPEVFGITELANTCRHDRQSCLTHDGHFTVRVDNAGYIRMGWKANGQSIPTQFVSSSACTRE